MDEFTEDVLRSLAAKRGETRDCRRCNKKWVDGDWNFYDLCPDCFEEFDTQKMKGRCPPPPGQPSLKLGVDYFESSTGWIASKPPIEKT